MNAFLSYKKDTSVSAFLQALRGELPLGVGGGGELLIRAEEGLWPAGAYQEKRMSLGV